MKQLLVGLFFFIGAAAYAQVSVSVNGTQYQCSSDGSNSGGNTGINYCRCRAAQYNGSADYDYYLEKYDPKTNAYTLLQTFALADAANNDIDRGHCMDARQDPGCFFATSASRFMQVKLPAMDILSQKKQL